MNLKSLFSASTPRGRATRTGTEKSVTAVTVGGVIAVAATAFDAPQIDWFIPTGDPSLRKGIEVPLDALAGVAALAGATALHDHAYARHLANTGTCALAVSTFRYTGKGPFTRKR